MPEKITHGRGCLPAGNPPIPGVATSPEMTRRERAPGPGFQILFKLEGTPFVCEGDYDAHSPGPVLGRVSATSTVVISKTQADA